MTAMMKKIGQGDIVTVDVSEIRVGDVIPGKGSVTKILDRPDSTAVEIDWATAVLMTGNVEVWREP